MIYPIETIMAYIPVSQRAIENLPEGLKHETINSLADMAHMTAVEGGKPRRKVGYYRSRFRRGRFVGFVSMRVSTEQPLDFFIRNIYAFTMDAQAFYTRNRRVKWTHRT